MLYNSCRGRRHARLNHTKQMVINTAQIPNKHYKLPRKAKKKFVKLYGIKSYNYLRVRMHLADGYMHQVREAAKFRATFQHIICRCITNDKVTEALNRLANASSHMATVLQKVVPTFSAVAQIGNNNYLATFKQEI